MNDDLKTKADAAAQVIMAARVTMRELDQHIAELVAALATFRERYRDDMQLRAREAAVLAREDRCTIRERELEKQKG